MEVEPVVEQQDRILDDFNWTEVLNYLGARGFTSFFGQELQNYTERSTGVIYLNCVFHVERTPSLVLRQTSGRYCCYGCGQTGDKIDFLYQIGAVEDIEGIEFIAKAIASINQPPEQGRLF